MSSNNTDNSANPFVESGSQMVLQVPKEIKVKLVNSSELNNLKIWSGLASLFSNFAVGFWVWCGQNTKQEVSNFLIVAAILTTAITLLFFCLAFYFNEKLKQETSEISYSPNQ